MWFHVQTSQIVSERYYNHTVRAAETLTGEPVAIFSKLQFMALIYFSMKEDLAAGPHNSRYSHFLSGGGKSENFEHFIVNLIPEKGIQISPDEIHQYYGKWPFTRMYGIQEPASTLFSLANALAHCFGYWNYLKIVKSSGRSHFMVRWIKANFIISFLVWIFSSLFHARDTPFTEALDYNGASLMLFFSNAYTWIRIFNYNTKRNSSYVACMVICLWLLHVFSLQSMPSEIFYPWNMFVCICVGVFFNLQWMFWLYKTYYSGKIRFAKNSYKMLNNVNFPFFKSGMGINYYHRKRAILLFACLFYGLASASLEIWDIPSYSLGYLLDSHALWHLATVPMVLLLYQFFGLDFMVETSIEHLH